MRTHRIIMRTHRITTRTHRSPSTPPVVDTTPTPETALESHTSIPTWPTDIHKYDASKVGVNLSQGLLLCNKDDTNFSMASQPLITPFTEAKTSLPSPRGTLRVLLEVTETATNGGLSSTSARGRGHGRGRGDCIAIGWHACGRGVGIVIVVVIVYSCCRCGYGIGNTAITQRYICIHLLAQSGIH